MCKLGNDHTDDALGHHTAVAQGLADGIRIEVVLAGILLDGLPPLFADAGRILQGSRNSCNGDSKLARNVLHRHGCLVVHLVFNDSRCKDTKKN